MRIVVRKRPRKGPAEPIAPPDTPGAQTLRAQIEEKEGELRLAEATIRDLKSERAAQVRGWAARSAELSLVRLSSLSGGGLHRLARAKAWRRGASSRCFSSPRPSPTQSARPLPISVIAGRRREGARGGARAEERAHRPARAAPRRGDQRGRGAVVGGAIRLSAGGCRVRGRRLLLECAIFRSFPLVAAGGRQAQLNEQGSSQMAACQST